MRILITGCNGLLGQKLLHTFATDVHDLLGVDLAAASLIPDVPCEYTQLDITDRRAVADFIRRMEPAIVIHTAAMTDVDGCERSREKCWRVNVGGTDNLVRGAGKVGARLIFISTDYVFDGKSGPYNEDDNPAPVSYYGRSKLAAENLVRGSGLEWTIARTIVLYGIGVGVKSSFVTWLLSMLREGREVRIVNDQWGNTTIVDDLATALERMVLLGRSGIYHVGGRGYMSRYEFALKAAEVFGLDHRLIHPIATTELRQPAPRPLRSGLEIDKAERDLFIQFRTVRASLELYKQQEAETVKEGEVQ